MKAKWTKPRQDHRLPVGVHLASIVSVNYARNTKGELIMQEEHPVIEITFLSSGEKVVERISTHPKSQWIWDSLSKALMIDNRNSSISASEAKGRLLYIIIAAEVEMDENERLKTNPDGTLFYNRKMKMEFYPYFEGGFAPIFNGHPDKNNGIPSGKFLINKGIEVKQVFKEQVQTSEDDF
ncbi:MAG TPA: hypothetical protein P5522_09825 [Spirochaetia bacterium]|nr:hypothetical protein [Spirochaetia bacterium]